MVKRRAVSKMRLNWAKSIESRALVMREREIDEQGRLSLSLSQTQSQCLCNKLLLQ